LGLFLYGAKMSGKFVITIGLKIEQCGYRIFNLSKWKLKAPSFLIKYIDGPCV